MAQGTCTPRAVRRLVLEFAKETGLGCAILHNGRQLEQLPGPTPLVCALHGAHLYFYKDRVCKRLLGWNSKPTNAKLRREHQASASTPPAHEWGRWEWKLAPGHYHAEEEQIAGIRAWFLAGGRSPRVIMKDAASVRLLIYACTAKDKGRGNICVHAVPPEFEQIKTWLERLSLGIKYTGQGLPAISAHVLLLLVKRGKQREHLSGEAKVELLEHHGHLCALCGQKSSNFEWDHIVGLQQLCAGQEQRFQPLCSPCHEMKTSQTGRALSTDFLASHFEKSVWDAYHSQK